ncbi:hypothetical protein SAMN05216359_105260 [Roseateles sp. YR242]|uniref:hypothetical protein n=1 Tax=Roseateles sp. YR242 TaxID=1855305 RepID=UPI0008C739B4|nr:hypothetical protein [Roseateles sp. YR242]SEL11807.1 hypothetical protein SAMN05216359_105260 [Roseateles sp. YR242]
MSTFGIRIKTPGLGLLVASDGFGLNYIGKASFVQDEVAPDMNGLSPGGGTKPTFKRYRIVTASPVVVPFLSLSTRCCGVAKMTRSGNTWDFVVFNQDASNVAAPIDIYCFGRPTTHSTYGMRIRQNDGVTLAYEFGLNRNLMFAGVVDLAAGVSSATIPSGIVTPAVMGFALGFIDPAWVLVNAARNQWRADAYIHGWTLSGTVIARAQRQQRVNGDVVEYGAGESPGNENYTGRAVTAFLIDANGLT